MKRELITSKKTEVSMITYNNVKQQFTIETENGNIINCSSSFYEYKEEQPDTLLMNATSSQAGNFISDFNLNVAVQELWNLHLEQISRFLDNQAEPSENT